MNLVYCNKFYSKKRDSLSLYFEYAGSVELIRVHKVYYIAKEFKELTQDNGTIDALDLKESIIDLGTFDLLESIEELAYKLNNQSKKNDVENDLSKSLFLIINQFGRINLKEQTNEFISMLNSVFLKYRFSINENAFFIDDIYEEIDNKIEFINFERKSLFDFKEDNEPQLDNISPDESYLYELRVFNVGQANCSALIKYKDDKKKDYDVVVVFDLGYQKKNGKNSKLDEMISKIDNNTTIIISHFHQDHINNITKHCQIMTNRWVFPSCDPSKHKAYKVFQALLCVATKKTYSGNVYVFPTPYSLSFNLSIHQHNGKATDFYQKGDNVNAQSLVCDLSIGEKRVLIPGDALYEEYDTLNLDSPFDFVLVPHHGCLYSDKQNTPKVKKINRVVGKDTYGIASCGYNTYGHANISHLSWYSNYYLFNNVKIYDDNKNHLKTSYVKREDYFPVVFE